MRRDERGALLTILAVVMGGSADAQAPAFAAVHATPLIIDLKPAGSATIRGNVVLLGERGETSVVVTLYDTRPLSARGDSARLRYAASLRQGTCAVPQGEFEVIAEGIRADGSAAGGSLDGSLDEIVATRQIIYITEEKSGRGVACAVVRRG